jgi:hypothetical protein
MKNLLLQLCLFSVAASVANAAVPPLNVTISDPAGKLAYKGATKNDGGFASEKLPPGIYVVQFNSKNAALKGGQYSIIVAAGSKKVVANSVAGEKFLGGGVAMKVQVGTGLNIIGHVSAGPLATLDTQKDSVRRAQDQSQDTHQQGFRNLPGNTPDKMYRPGN